MDDLARQAIAAAESIQRSAGYRTLSASERAEIDRDFGRIAAALGAPRPVADPYAVPFATPADLPRGPNQPPPPTSGGGGRPPPRPTPPAGTEVLGERTRRALDAVDFPSFVAELIQGTFQAIVDATAKQVREYAKLVADISQSVDDFTRDNVSNNQARDWLVGRHPQDLELVLPEPGSTTQPRVRPRREGESPEWLDRYELGGEELTEELTEGPLLQRAQRSLGEERLRTLATMVLMGINRIVVDDGQLRARLQFHARARESVSAEVVAANLGQQTGIAARQTTMGSAVSTMVSTVDVNTQANVSIKADLAGEIFLRFRTETFDLQNFAGSDAVGFITRHSQTKALPQTTGNGTGDANGAPPPPASGDRGDGGDAT